MVEMADVLSHKWLSLPKLAISISNEGENGEIFLILREGLM